MEGLDPYNSPEYAAYIEGMEAAEEAHQINGLDGPCTKCGEYSVLTGSVCTLGYRGHPGAEFSTTYECINPECQHAEIA